MQPSRLPYLYLQKLAKLPSKDKLSVSITISYALKIALILEIEIQQEALNPFLFIHFSLKPLIYIGYGI